MLKIISESANAIRIVLHIKEKRKPIIHGISIQNNQRLPFTFIYRLLGSRPGDELDMEKLNRRLMEIYGLGYFEGIHYMIEPADENVVNLIFTVKELPIRKLRVGLRYDDFHKLVAVVNVQATNLFIPGIRFEHELQFAGLFKYSLKTYYPSRAFNAIKKIPRYGVVIINRSPIR